MLARSHLLKSNQNSTLTFPPEYAGGSCCIGLASRMARTAEESTEALPLDLVTWILVTVPSRKMSNVATTRGANCTRGSTVDCSQVLLTLRCTASTYQEKRSPKFPAPGPSKPMPACVLAPAPSVKELYGTVGVPPPP